MDVKQTLYVSSGKKKSHNIRDCYIIVRNVTSFLLKLPTFHIPIGKSHKEFKNLISVRGFFFLFFHAKFLHGQNISTVFMMMLFSLVDIYLTVINKNPLSESSLSWGSMFLWYYISKAVHWMCSGLIFFFWYGHGKLSVSLMRFLHTQCCGLWLSPWVSPCEVGMRHSLHAQYFCLLRAVALSVLLCHACHLTTPQLCKRALMCPGAPVTMSRSALELLAFVGLVTALLPVWHSSLHRYPFHLFPVNSEVLSAVKRKHIKQSNSTASETYPWGTPS